MTEKSIEFMGLFHEVIEGMADGFALFGADERLVGCNEQYRNLYPTCRNAGLFTLGIKYEDFVRAGAERGLVPGAVGRVEDHVKARLAEFRDPTGMIEVVRHDGTWIRLENRKTADGRTICLRKDITDVKSAELARREVEGRLNDAQRIAGIGSWERDIHADTLWWSDEVYRIFGVVPMMVLPSYEFITSSIYPDDRERAISAINRIRIDGEPYDIDHRIIVPTGDVRWVRQQAELIRDSAGNPAVLRGTIHDITTRKQAEEKITELNAQLEGRVGKSTKELAESQHRFRDFAEIGADWYWEADAEYRFTWFSIDTPRLRRMLGARRWDVGDDYPGLTDWSVVRSRVIEREAFQELDVAVKGMDGAPMWISTSGKPLFDADGRYIGYRGVTRDVTKRRGVELALSGQRKLFDQLITTTSQGYWYIDMEGRILDVNPAMCEILGRFREEVIGRSILEFADELNQSIFEEQLASRRRGVVGAYEIELRRADGSSVACIDNPTPIFAPTGERAGTVGFWTNISAIKEIQASLEAANAAVRKASQAKTEFLSSMSHELRTPLNAILGFGQLLEMDSDHPLVDDQSESVRQILKGGNYLLGLIDEVLDLSTIESGNIDLSIEPVDIGSIAFDCVDVLRPIASNAGVEIENRIDRGSEFWILADHTRLKQVLLNLLSNAIKYNSPGGRIIISSAMVDGKAAGPGAPSMHRITVADTGLGIPELQRDGVFVPFERLGQEVGEIEGTGIGLSISKKLIDLMAGEIDFESQEGMGTTFWVDLPISMARDQTWKTDTKDVPPSQAPVPQADATQRCVLYVEDNPANISLMERIVQRLPNVTLVSAHTAELGLEIARRHQPEIIILDINLPGMDGFEALARILRNPQTRDIPVIALSANAKPATIQRGLDAGFRYYLTKPINVPELLDAFANVTKLRG